MCTIAEGNADRDRDRDRERERERESWYRKSPLFLPVCLFPSMQPLRCHVEISVLPSEYFWMAATVSPRGSRSVVQVPCSLIYFRLPPLSLQTHRTLPATLDRDSTVPRELCFLLKLRKDLRFFHHPAKFLVFSCHFYFYLVAFFFSVAWKLGSFSAFTKFLSLRDC